MALVQIVGPVVAPNGVPAVSGTIHAKLKVPGKLADGSAVAGAKLVRLENGSIPLYPVGHAQAGESQLQLYPVADISPSSYYEVSCVIRDAETVEHKWMWKWAPVASASPVYVGDVLIVEGTPPVVYGPDAATLAARDAAQAAQAGAEDAVQLAVSQVYTTATLPTPTEELHAARPLVRVKDEGQDEEIYWIARLADGTFEWQLLGGIFFITSTGAFLTTLSGANLFGLGA